ncbi:MAG: sulfatase, partial [uncultured bacterium]
MFIKYFHRLSLPQKSSVVLFCRRAVSTVLPFIVLSLILLAISLSFGMAGGIDEYFTAFNHELPLLLVVYASLLYLMRPGIWRTLIAAVPILVLYLGMDLYYVYMHSIFKLDDLLLLPEGLTVSPIWVRGGVWLALFAWSAGFLILLRRRPRELVLPLLLLVIAVVPPITAFTAPKQFLKAAESQGLNVIPWSDRWTSASVGRATSLLLFAATKHKAMAELAMLPMVEDPERDPAVLKSTLHEARNIHILVLESFLDPERFKALKYKTPTAPPQFQALRKKMHIAESPVFGGGTAQAEFEVLCGVPALELYTSAEFNMLEGTRAPCLPSMLAEVGYRTVATQSYKPDFFNSEKAYRSLGFEETNFPTAFAGSRPTYLQYKDSEHYIFDGDLFSQNLLYVQKLITDGKPFLNYVLGVYGHLPHETDIARFPPKVEIVGVDKNSQTYLAIQQFYYRAEAVADYLKKLREIDPKSLILVTSDHLPPLDGGPKTYKNFGYTLTANDEYRQNIWLYDGPQHKKLAWPDHYYEYMDFILDILTEER